VPLQIFWTKFDPRILLYESEENFLLILMVPKFRENSDKSFFGKLTVQLAWLYSLVHDFGGLAWDMFAFRRHSWKGEKK